MEYLGSDAGLCYGDFARNEEMTNSSLLEWVYQHPDYRCSFSCSYTWVGFWKQIYDLEVELLN